MRLHETFRSVHIPKIRPEGFCIILSAVGSLPRFWLNSRSVAAVVAKRRTGMSRLRGSSKGSFKGISQGSTRVSAAWGYLARYGDSMMLQDCLGIGAVGRGRGSIRHLSLTLGIMLQATDFSETTL